MINEFLKDLPSATFPVKHEAFYEELRLWRTDSNNASSNSNKKCVYILHTPRSIPRVIGNDPNGILYIGKGSMEKNHERIGALINSINGKSKTHGAGYAYDSIPKYSELYPLKEFSLAVYFANNSEKIESKLLRLYLERYGEYPPLNRVG